MTVKYRAPGDDRHVTGLSADGSGDHLSKAMASNLLAMTSNLIAIASILNCRIARFKICDSATLETDICKKVTIIVFRCGSKYLQMSLFQEKPYGDAKLTHALARSLVLKRIFAWAAMQSIAPPGPSDGCLKEKTDHGCHPDHEGHR